MTANGIRKFEEGIEGFETSDAIGSWSIQSEIGIQPQMRCLRQIRCGNVEFFEIDAHPFKMLGVLKPVEKVAALDARDVRERVIRTVNNSRRSFAAQNVLIAFRASYVLAVIATNEICHFADQKRAVIHRAINDHVVIVTCSRCFFKAAKCKAQFCLFLCHDVCHTDGITDVFLMLFEQIKPGSTRNVFDFYFPSFYYLFIEGYTIK